MQKLSDFTYMKQLVMVFPDVRQD